MVHDEGGVDRHADMICQRRIDIGLLEGVQFPVLDIAKARREALADQAEQRKNMIAGAAGIGEQLLDLQNRVVVEQAVEHIDGLAFGRADRQDAVIAVLVGKPAVELRARLAAIMQVDVAAPGGPVAGTKELPIG